MKPSTSPTISRSRSQVRELLWEVGQGRSARSWVLRGHLLPAAALQTHKVFLQSTRMPQPPASQPSKPAAGSCCSRSSITSRRTRVRINHRVASATLSFCGCTCFADEYVAPETHTVRHLWFTVRFRRIPPAACFPGTQSHTLRTEEDPLPLGEQRNSSQECSRNHAGRRGHLRLQRRRPP